MSEESKSPSPTSKKLTVYGGITILLAFIYYIAFLRRSFTRCNLPFPYYWTPNINRTLQTYVQTVPSRHILFITGSSRSGKSSAMNAIAETLSDHLVIKLDATTMNETDIWDHLKNQISQYLSKHKQTKAINALTVSAKSGKSIWDTLDFLEANYNSFHPVIFVHGSDRLLKGRFRKEVVAYFSRRNQYKQNIPVVAEINNTNLIEPFKRSNNVRVIETEGISKANVEDLIRKKYFSSYEIRRINNAFGPHPGALSKIYEDLKFDIQVESAIEALQKSGKYTMMKAPLVQQHKK